MEYCLISTILFADSGRLEIYPKDRTFELIHRAALGVFWDNKFKCLYTPLPKNWTYHEWFNKIMTAVKTEYNCALVIDDSINWCNIPPDMINEIKNSFPELLQKKEN